MAKNLQELTKDLLSKLGKNEETQKITVFSAIKLDSEDLKTISSYLKKEHSIEAPIENKIDKSVIAGVKIAYKDLELDYSLAGKVNRLGKAIA